MECAQNGCTKEAVAICHWPGEDTSQCLEHCRGLDVIYKAMGAGSNLTFTDLTTGVSMHFVKADEYMDVRPTCGGCKEKFTPATNQPKDEVIDFCPECVLAAYDSVDAPIVDYPQWLREYNEVTHGNE